MAVKNKRKVAKASDLAWSGTTGFITGGTNFKTTLIVNTVSSGLQGYFESNQDSIKHAGYKAASSAIATSLGGAVGKSMEKTADMAILKGLSKNRSYYNPEYRNRNFYYTGYEDYKKYPVRLGVAADSFTGESLNKFLESNEQDIRNFSRERLYAKQINEFFSLFYWLFFVRVYILFCWYVFSYYII